MRSILLNFVFVIFSFNKVLAQDTITIYYNQNWVEIPDKNQASFYRKAFRDSNKVWTAHDYYISNKIQMIGTFKSKKLTVKQGHFTYFYENGKKSSEGEYVNNNSEGFWTYWHENGRIKSQGMIIDNEVEDKWEYWFSTGEKQSEGKFLHGKKDGTWKYFYKTGHLETLEIYSNCKLSFMIGYFEIGGIKFQGSFVNEKSDGEWTYYNVDGKLILKGNYSKNSRVGEWTRFFPNGGSMKMYYEKGELVSKQLGGIYQNE